MITILKMTVEFHCEHCVWVWRMEVDNNAPAETTCPGCGWMYSFCIKGAEGVFV